jgi:RNA polymerase sigma factor (sigma-70 family)
MITFPKRIVLGQLRQLFREPTNEPTDRELLLRFSAGDEHAFATLVHRHGRMVLAVCLQLLDNRADAEDAFQAVFVALSRKADHPGSAPCIGGWLHAVARRAAVKLRTTITRRRLLEREASNRDPSTISCQADLREVLDEEVSRLPARCREAILRCYFHGQTREQAARQLGWSLRTLERRLEQGRQILRKRLTARGTTLAVLLALTPAAVSSALANATVRAALGEAPARVAELAGSAVSGLAVLRGKVVFASLLLLGLAAGTALALLPRMPEPVRAAVAAPVQRPAAPPSLEQPLPEGALARLGTTRFRHGFLIYGIAWSRDGKILASVGSGRALCLWDANTGQFLHHCNTGRRFPASYALAISPDSRTVANAEGASVKLWSIETGKELRDFTGHTNGVVALAFSPRGKVLASGGHDTTIRLWDPDTGRERFVLKGHSSTVRALAFRDDGRVLASASDDGTVRLWNPRVGREMHICKRHKQEVYALAFEPGGKRLVSSGVGGNVRIWDSDSGKQERIFASEKQSSNALAFAPDGKLLAVARKGSIVLHETSTGKELRRWQAHTADIKSLAWSPDGNTLASGAIWDSTLRRWDPKTGKERTLAEETHVGPVDHLLFRKDGRRLFSAGRDGRLLEWDPKTRTARSIAPALPVPSCLRVFAMTPDGKTLAWASRRSAEQVIHLYDLATGKQQRELTGHTGAVLAVAFDVAGQRLASMGADRTVRVWQVSTGEQTWQAPVGTGRAGPVSFRWPPFAFSPNGKSVACELDTTLHVLDAATGKETRRYKYGREAFALAWSPDSSQIALVDGFDGPSVALWDVRTGEISRSWQGPGSGTYGIAFSPDGRFIATGSTEGDSRVAVWELATGGKLAVFEGHHSAVIPVAFSPDNRMLVSGGGDSSVLLWDLTGRAKNGKLRPGAISAAGFSQLWDRLADDEAKTAYSAVWELVADGPGVLPMLKSKLPVAAALDAKRAAKLVEQLDSDDFETRQRAMKEAEKLGLGAEPALRKALAARPGLEPRRRVDAVVAGWLRSSDWLRYRRAVAVLEYIGSAEAKQILASLAGGAEGARPTKEAAAALVRLRNRR